jgi:hypothetical protein
MNDSVISRIVYCIIADIGGELDDIEGRIYDANGEKDFQRLESVIYAAEGKAILAARIGEILKDEGYEALGDLLYTTCNNEATDRSSNALQLLKEEVEDWKKREADDAS